MPKDGATQLGAKTAVETHGQHLEETEISSAVIYQIA